jgi:acyl dehydratase
MPRTFENLDAFRAAEGEELGTGDWMTISQDQINLFADATKDHQWIHVDPERAAQGPFGGTIAHGYLTVSLLPALAASIYQIEGLTMGVNYGINKLRFPSPVPVDSRVRATATLREVSDIAIGTQAVISFVVEREGGDKPACIADVVYVMAS